ncbi:DUF6473 family protein, partial [Cognatishimia sp. WU-CL00825]|uniref:DUF6473 family protein n=1 Tax=Cognatishimia sp. WU-CL00825 TaxID=3127658 RepID=UPI0033657528
MSYEDQSRRALDYDPCRYGSSRIYFRGPKKLLQGNFIAFLGGTETYGKYIKSPFAQIVEANLDIPCVNFGCVNAGVDAFVHDPEVLAAAGQAQVTVVQVVGAQNMSNRYYKVHPRRNDRLVMASPLMKSVFRDIDFTEFNFTRHMLQELSLRAGDRFSFVREELRAAWSARMKVLLGELPGKKILLWCAERSPPKRLPKFDLGADPMFVDATMIEALRPYVDAINVVRISALARRAGTQGMCFRPLEEPAARQMLGPIAHLEIAESLVE